MSSPAAPAKEHTQCKVLRATGTAGDEKATERTVFGGPMTLSYHIKGKECVRQGKNLVHPHTQAKQN